MIYQISVLENNTVTLHPERFRAMKVAKLALKNMADFMDLTISQDGMRASNALVLCEIKEISNA